jgi:hypothetical protein
MPRVGFEPTIPVFKRPNEFHDYRVGTVIRLGTLSTDETDVPSPRLGVPPPPFVLPPLLFLLQATKKPREV